LQNFSVYSKEIKLLKEQEDKMVCRLSFNIISSYLEDSRILFWLTGFIYLVALYPKFTDSVLCLHFVGSPDVVEHCEQETNYIVLYYQMSSIQLFARFWVINEFFSISGINFLCYIQFDS
jgi:hypothetical protein